MFWTDATTGWSRIDITLDGRSIGSLTSYLDSSPFGCSTSDDARVVATLSPGTYSYRAEDVGGEVSWSGDNVTIDSGSCLKYQLSCGDDRRCGPDRPPASDGRGGTYYDGQTPAPQGFSDRLNVTGAGDVGTLNSMELCVWDYATIDGDLINLWFAGEQLTYSSGDTTIELFAEETCWTRTVSTQYYYEVRVRALNEGSISPNTGAIRASIGSSRSSTEEWNVPLHTGGTTSLVVTGR